MVMTESIVVGFILVVVVDIFGGTESWIYVDKQ